MSILKVAAVIHPSAPSGGLSLSSSGNVTGAGMDLITTQTFSAVNTVSVDNCFTSTYEHYAVSLHLTSSSASVTMRFRVGGVDNSTSNYSSSNGYLTGWNGAASGQGVSSGTSFGISTAAMTEIGCVYNVMNPALSRKKIICGSYAISTGAGALGGYFNATTVFDGFSILGTSMTGTLRVYGLRN